MTNLPQVPFDPKATAKALRAHKSDIEDQCIQNRGEVVYALLTKNGEWHGVTSSIIDRDAFSMGSHTQVVEFRCAPSMGPDYVEKQIELWLASQAQQTPSE